VWRIYNIAVDHGLQNDRRLQSYFPTALEIAKGELSHAEDRPTEQGRRRTRMKPQIRKMMDETQRRWEDIWQEVHASESSTVGDAAEVIEPRPQQERLAVTYEMKSSTSI
jgi:hypothetical protein